MGCCMSHYSFFEKETVHEVVLDANGVAQRVPKGQGTHFIHISPNNETHLEEKSEHPPASPPSNKDWPSLTTPSSYNKKVHPVASEELKKEDEKTTP